MPMEAQNKGSGRSKNLDRLSGLPDSIIHEILRFLDTKEAIKTCVLSKRWKTIWTCLPDLNFCFTSFSCNSRFTQFIDKVLSTRDDSCSVRKFRFLTRCTLNDSLFHKIVNYAESHNVQRLKVKGCSLCVPLRLSFCESLRTLKLWGFEFKEDMQSTSFCLTRLTSLRLSFCSFSCLGDICDPFASCTNLKNLFLENSSFHGTKILKISGPQLLNLKFTRAETKDCYKVEIVAPKLESFIIKQDNNVVDFSELDLPSLNHVDVELRSRKKESRDNLYLINLFRGLYNTKYLKLDPQIVEALSLVPGLLEQQPSPFKRLKSLKVDFSHQRWSFDDESFTIPTNVMTYLLGGSPHADYIRVDRRKVHLS